MTNLPYRIECAAEGSTPAREREGEELRSQILVVEDDAQSLGYLTQILRERGYKVRTAPTAALALSAAKTAPPDLILLDIRMPEKNGYEICAELQGDEATQGIPVIFVSALDDVVDKVKAFSAGGVDYITKPIQDLEVLARVDTHLRLHRMQAALDEKNRRLNEQNAELDAFARTVAHDLKNPLTVVSGYADLLATDLGETLDDGVRESLTKIEEGCGKMAQIIDELLLFANVRKAETEALPLDMRQIVESSCQLLARAASESRAEIIHPDLWPNALGHAPWIERVWTNYISNAIKYGGDPPRVELGADPARGGKVHFWVRDNGPGIDESELRRVFDEFSRIAPNGVEGHGLGLSIVKRIVDKLGGEVTVRSAPGEGSTFGFTLPATSEAPGR